MCSTVTYSPDDIALSSGPTIVNDEDGHVGQSACYIVNYVRFEKFLKHSELSEADFVSSLTPNSSSSMRLFPEICSAS